MTKSVKIVLCSLIILLPALIIWTVWGNTALMVSKITISSVRIPEAFSGFRIVQISDLHNSEFGKNNAKLLKLLSENEPDIIVVTGDLVDVYHTNIDTVLNFVKEAVQLAPVYYVTGNHEAGLLQYDILETEIKAMGVSVLNDEAVSLELNDERIMLVGLSDPSFTNNSNMFGEASAIIGTKLKNMIDAEAGYTIVLSHRPEFFEIYAECGADLVFSGHAHGGQFRLPFIGGLIAPNQGLFPKYDSGLYTDGNTRMIVSRGIGNSIIPFRFNNRPEIVLAELNSQ